MSPIPAVILAAGASRRLGRPKQLVEVGGEPLLRRTARLALGACHPVLVVLGHGAEAMAAALEGLDVVRVDNPHWEEGMASSLRAGLAALPPCEAALFLVSDQPGLEAAVLEAVLAAGGPEDVAACAYGGALGIPTRLPRRVFGELAGLRGDQGARALLRREAVAAVPFPAGALDLDVPEDLEALRAQTARS